MFECKVCGYVCSRGSGHIKSKHDKSTIEYLKIYEDIDVVVLYEEGKSAQQISNLIKQKNLGVNPIKKDILFYLNRMELVLNYHLNQLSFQNLQL